MVGRVVMKSVEDGGKGGGEEIDITRKSGAIGEHGIYQRPNAQVHVSPTLDFVNMGLSRLYQVRRFSCFTFFGFFSSVS
ncbi:hypothetical protein Tco_1445427 [Tanacetum coccineum]